MSIHLLLKKKMGARILSESLYIEQDRLFLFIILILLIYTGYWTDYFGIIFP